VNRPKLILISVLLLCLSLASILGGCSETNTSKPKVVTSTSLIAFIAEQVAGDLVEIVNIIPPAQCPGHFDVKPSDIQSLSDADLFLIHGWQGETFAAELIGSANNPDLIVVTIGTTGNWMTPSVQAEASDEITAALCQVDSQNSSVYEESAADYVAAVTAKGEAILADIASADLSQINVLCADQQAGFVAWTGLNIIAIFGRPDSLTPQVVQDLVDQGVEGNVTLIIDNLQSGQDAGAGIAEELGCSRIILSNFPGGFDNTETWEKAIDRNIELILEAVAS